jgi:hypothetical protein
VWTRSSDRWTTRPGSWDTLNLRQRFDSDNEYGIPYLTVPSIKELPEPPTCLLPYNLRVRSEVGYKDAAMHFFLDDYRFEFVWNKPNQAFERISKAWLVVTPDFSLYADYPIAAQIWNTYRNRWCGALWQSKGLVVVPTIAWSTPESYSFCFDGVSTGSPVAISTQGIKWDDGTYKRFEHGFNTMMDRINPRFVISYGKVDDKLRKLAPDSTIREYPTYWAGLKKARKLGIAEDFYTGAATVHNGEF